MWQEYSSNGTLFGAYEFLERLTGVMWLMPGEYGEDTPPKGTLVFAQTNDTCKPAFPCRVIEYVQDRRPEVQEWLLRQKTQAPAQKERIEMFGDNMRMLHYHMRQASLFAEPKKSEFYLTDVEF